MEAVIPQFREMMLAALQESGNGGEFNRSLQHCSPKLSGVALEQFHH
jgi:hypothetical protein